MKKNVKAGTDDHADFEAPEQVRSPIEPPSEMGRHIPINSASWHQHHHATDLADDLGAYLASILDADDGAMPSTRLAEILEHQDGAVYIALRKAGVLKHELWVKSRNQLQAIRTAFSRSRETFAPTDWRGIDTIELCLSYGSGPVDLRSKTELQRFAAKSHQGIRGIQLNIPKNPRSLRLVSPTAMIAANQDVGSVLAAYCAMHRLQGDDIEQGTCQIRIFQAAQFLLCVDRRHSGTERRARTAQDAATDTASHETPATALPHDPTRADADVPIVRAVPLLRGKRYVPLEEIHRPMVERLQQLLGDYLIRGVQKNGRMRYLYSPSHGREGQKRNNQIRQWMASLALCRLAKYRQCSGVDDSGSRTPESSEYVHEIYDVAKRNIRYNLNRFYYTENEFGLINDQGKVKLGAVAMAALALIEHPAREEFKEMESRLLNTIDHLWQPSGKFRTFYRPAARDDQHNFYPGEALLTWCVLYRENQDRGLLDRILTSYAYYRRWHLDHRNPAFISWHTQAYFILWQQTREQSLCDFIFQMNDWLLGVQQWDDVPYEDCRGQFFDPSRPFGPPHASSTGVYMEGLVDAFQLARQVGDQTRAESYRIAILRALRSIAQLTFKDNVDMFYVSKRHELRGGVRTAVYDNTVRVDNVQHNLMAIFKILPAFQPSDYQI